MAFWKKPEFKALQQEWYQRLKDEGFDDIESGDAVRGHHEAMESAVYNALNEITRDTKEAYYQFVSQKVQETVFVSDIDRIILAGHADGKKIRHICEELQKVGVPRCRGTIRFKIRIYEMKWGLRQYTPKQLNRKIS